MKRFLVAVVGALVVVGCSSPGSSPATPSSTAAVPATSAPIELTIYGAASLKGVLDAAKAAYESGNQGVRITISTDSSAALEAKIEQGAPADLFLSADTSNPQKLVDKGLVEGDAVNFAGNELTIIVPTDNPARIATPFDIGKPGVKVIAAGADVPITKYARQLVANLAGLPDAPARLADSYSANVLSEEENVKGIVAKIELGEGDAGIVYVTDAAASSKVKVIAIPTEANVPATYAAVVIRASTHQAEALAFMVWLTGPDGLAILQGLGFLPPPE